MLNFFIELDSDIVYCHVNNIVHRELKPDSILGHNDTDGNHILKIAPDLGLPSTFNLTKADGHSSQRQISCDVGVTDLIDSNSLTS